jgi:NAD(P)-dependent dehydrogenase (short-subunit alcohol dehydrogenase family)
MKAILVVGASRGIGLGLAGAFLARGWRVTATERTAAPGLDALVAEAGERLDRAHLVLGDRGSEAAFLAATAGARFDAIVFNAGIFGPRHQSTEAATREEIAELMDVNALAPSRLAHRLLPRLAAPHGVLAFLTSRLGSVAENRSGAMDLYRMSKAALNMATRSLAAGADVRDVTILSLHPGWVKTDMGGEAAPIEVEASATGLAEVIERMAGRQGHHFLDWEGNIIAW